MAEIPVTCQPDGAGWAGRAVSLRRGVGHRGEHARLPAGPGEGWPAACGEFPGGLAALCSPPAAPGPVGNWGRGEQMFVIMEQLTPERRERAGKEAARPRGLGAGSASRSRVPRAILSWALFK